MKKGKLRILAVLCAAVLCMAVFPQAALADGGYCESNGCDDNTQVNPIDSITVSTEDVKLQENQGSEALTPDGNLSLIDDILQNESYYESDKNVVKDKQFITVQTKGGNYFYIIIDRSGSTENVYFLNMVDEADLMALMEDSNTESIATCTCIDKCVVGNVNTSCPVCRNNIIECKGKETIEPITEPDADPDADINSEKKTGANTGLLLVMLLIALAGGALYWFKFRKPKGNNKGGADLDDYDYGEDEDDEEYEFEKDDADEDVPPEL